jgi:hypothetical protein
VSATGAQANGVSGVEVAVSPNGHSVSFMSMATDLLGIRTSGNFDAFQRGPLA